MTLAIPSTVLAVVIMATTASPAQPRGRIALAQAAPHILIVWDAAPIIADIVKNKTLYHDAMAMLEAAGAQIMVDENAEVRNGTDVTLRVVYPRDPSFNPAYGTSVINTVERLMTLKAKARDIQFEGARWPAQIEKGRLPKKLSIQITGNLPPQ